MFLRSCVKPTAALERESQTGDGWMAMPRVTTVATAGALTIPVEGMLGGTLVYTGALGAVAYTYPTGTLIAAAFPEMDIGDTYVFTITNTAAQVATMTTAASGTTLTGMVTANANTRTVIMTKTAAAAFTLLHI
jgi:hypothetical protein